MCINESTQNQYERPKGVEIGTDRRVAVGALGNRESSKIKTKLTGFDGDENRGSRILWRHFFRSYVNPKQRVNVYRDQSRHKSLSLFFRPILNIYHFDRIIICKVQ